MNAPAASPADSYTIHWPEPAHLRLGDRRGSAEPCEIELNDGTIERGDLLRFTGRDEHLVFRPHPDHPRYPTKLVVKTSRFKRLRLTSPVSMEAIEGDALGQPDLQSPVQIQVYNVEFVDHEIESGDTNGFVRNAIGLFLFINRPGDQLQRIFVPEPAIAYFQAGDPIGRLLVEENAVSEEQLKAAVEKQQEMRKLVLGDYLIEEGLIDQGQLDAALAYQRTKPSLRLGEALIELGSIQSETLQIVLARQRANRGRPLGQILVDMGVLDTTTLNKIHAKKIGRPFVSLVTFKPSLEAVATIDAATARRLGVMPLSIEHGDLIVAAGSLLDASAINELTLTSRMRVVQVIAQDEEIVEAQNEGYGDTDSVGFDLDAVDVRFEGVDVESPSSDDDDDDAMRSGGGLRLRESVDGLADPQLRSAIDRALAAVDQGGTLEIHVIQRGGVRETSIRLKRDA